MDISRGEGDVQSSSDEENEESVRLEITEVWNLLVHGRTFLIILIN